MTDQTPIFWILGACAAIPLTYVAALAAVWYRRKPAFILAAADSYVAIQMLEQALEPRGWKTSRNEFAGTLEVWDKGVKAVRFHILPSTNSEMLVSYSCALTGRGALLAFFSGMIVLVWAALTSHRFASREVVPFLLQNLGKAAEPI